MPSSGRFSPRQCATNIGRIDIEFLSGKRTEKIGKTP